MFVPVRAVVLSCAVLMGGCAPLASTPHVVGASPAPHEPPESGPPSEPALLSNLQHAVGSRGRDLSELLLSLGFTAEELSYEPLCGEGPMTLHGPLESVESLSGNLDADPEDEWVVLLKVVLVPSAIPDRDQPAEHARWLLVLFDLEGEVFRIVGRWVAGSALTEWLDVRLVHVHDASAWDIYLVEQFDACLADPREVRMRDHTVLSMARGDLEPIWMLPTSRQGPWALGEEPPAEPVFRGAAPVVISCGGCFFKDRIYRFDADEFRYVEVGN